jgi:hypothetical protein
MAAQSRSRSRKGGSHPENIAAVYPVSSRRLLALRAPLIEPDEVTEFNVNKVPIISHRIA